MHNPAFIVDGQMERAILQKICPNQPVALNRNGKFVELSLMANNIARQIRIWGNKFYPIIILVDLEDRAFSYLDMAEQLRKLLIKEAGIINQNLKIGVADRMTENWIAADWEKLTGSDEKKPANADGNKGSNVIEKVKGTYGKTTDGVDLFLSARPKVMYANSPSFKHFADQLKDIECLHLQVLWEGQPA